MSPINNSPPKITSLKATAVSVEDKLYVSVVLEDVDNISHGQNVPTVKEALTFIGTYITEDKNLTELEKKELERRRKAVGFLRLHGQNLTDGDLSEFRVTKVESRGHNVSITFDATHKDDSSQTVVSFPAEFEGEGNLRTGEGEGYWSKAEKETNLRQILISVNATATSMDDTLKVSLIDDTPNAYGASTIEGSLTFFGKYDEENKSLTELEKKELEKLRKAVGHFEFQSQKFFDEYFSKFKVAKVKNTDKDDYDVTIAFDGFRHSPSSQEVASISAEFKGKGDLRVGKGDGKWCNKKNIADKGHEFISVTAIATSEANNLKVQASVMTGHENSAVEGTRSFVGEYDKEDKPPTSSEMQELEQPRTARGVFKFQDQNFLDGDSHRFNVTKSGNRINNKYDVTITIDGLHKDALSQEAVFKGEGDLRAGEGEGQWGGKEPNK